MIFIMLQNKFIMLHLKVVCSMIKNYFIARIFPRIDFLLQNISYLCRWILYVANIYYDSLRDKAVCMRCLKSRNVFISYS